jgi:hypothetical protein
MESPNHPPADRHKWPKSYSMFFILLEIPYEKSALEAATSNSERYLMKERPVNH